MSLMPVKKQQVWSVLGWVISSSNKLCARKLKSDEVRWPAFDLCRSSCIWMSLLKKHQIFIDNQCYASLKADQGGFVESIRKQKVFSEAPAIVYPMHCNSSNWLRNCTYSIIKESIGWVSCSSYRFIIKNYWFVNVSKRLFSYIPQEWS